MWEKEITNNIKNLISAVAMDSDKTKEDRLYIQNFIIERCLSFSKYVVATNEYVFTIHSISESRKNGDISQEEFERRLKNIDSHRRDYHNNAIDACNQLNRLCKNYNLDVICHSDTSDRSAIANFAASVALAIHGYALDHNYTMDEVVKEMEKDQNLLKKKTIFQNISIEEKGK